MGVLLVAVAVAVTALLLAAAAWWRTRFGRAWRALAGDAQRAAQDGVPRRAPRATPRPRLPFPFSYLNRRLREGGISTSVQAVVVAAAIGAVASWALATMVAGPGWVSAVAVLGGLWAPVLWVDRLATRRREAIAVEMERVAAALQGALAAGMVPYGALLEVAVASRGLLGPELLRVVGDADRLGLSEALALLRERLPLPEVGLLVSAIRLNQGAGSGLTPALDGLGRTLRERREGAAAMRAATASGRWQANMLVAVPPLLLMFLRQVYPGFEAPLFSTGTGRLLLAGAGGWLAIGYFVVLRMCVPRSLV